MIIIGLTGSIGMGKSETAKMFRAEGIPVFDADATVHALQAKDGKALPAIEDAFPGTVKDGVLDRTALGAHVFADSAALKQLERIMHPLVAAERQEFLEKAKTDGSKIIVFDEPILFEMGGDSACDYTVVVSAPYRVQRERVLARPGMTADKFEDILDNQLSDPEKRDRADYIVRSDKGLEDAHRQVKAILAELLEK